MSEAYERIAGLCEPLLMADGLSATLMSLIEAALAVGDASTAKGLADEIRAELGQHGPLPDETVRGRIEGLAASLDEVASES